ncbi:RICIN domain-containing protein [Actinoplanes sp. L3-i22]|uniref:RICIN domain-containing protein n=1 Tax=Actinoplanes sp. L3-i22 TaxID=2836373 RepID=UPI001C759E02|nr:ricin-type beta-trefoil lectin domain protein [Actinoplanes sp. L3-i22]BCY09022.1 hypothetical protein L3i22_041100 [Actinoplanes sp. L3-i22]
MLAIIIALAGLAIVPATAAQAATACSTYGSYWNRGPFFYAGLSASNAQGRAVVIDQASPYQTVAPGYVHMWHSNGPTNNQRWCLGTHQNNDLSYSYQVRNLQTGLCLDVQDDNQYAGDPVWMWTCKSLSDSTVGSQLWGIRKYGSASTPNGAQTVYNFRTYSDYYCLDVKDYGTADGSALQIWNCLDAGNQLFY